MNYEIFLSEIYGYKIIIIAYNKIKITKIFLKFFKKYFFLKSLNKIIFNIFFNIQAF